MILPIKAVTIILFFQEQKLMGRYTNDQQPKGKSAQSDHQNGHGYSHKASISFPQTSHYDEEDSNTPVLVYLHSRNNKSFKLELAPKISINEVKNIIQDRIGLKKDRQILYLNGKNITQYGYIRLQPQSIIHISNSDEICNPNEELHLKVKIMNFINQSQQKIYKKFIILPNDRISDFIVKLQKEISHIFNFEDQSVQYYLLESSRLLQKQKTFIEQDVTRQSDIICMITKNEIKTRFTNDTKEEIINDISELLGFNDEVENKPEHKQQERSVRPRYSREETHKQIQQIQKSQSQYQQSFDNTDSQCIPNFKKKKTPVAQATSFQDSRHTGLAKKIRSTKSKKQLDFLLNLQQRQTGVFQSPSTVKQQTRSLQVRPESVQVKEETISDMPKVTPQIPKVMPINERRRMRLEVEKLFDLGNSSKTKTTSSIENCDVKEEKRPISPPTEMPKQKERMRLSMGSRPAFLDQLRSMNLQ